MIDKKQQITGEYLSDLRDLLGVKAIDHYWLFGGIGKIKVTGEKAKEPYKNPSLCILARYLLKYPEEAPILSMPRFHEVYDALEDLTDTKLPNRKAGIIFGVSGWSGNRWYHGGKPSPVAERLFYILLNSIEDEGMDGLKKYLKVVDEEARSRGFVEGFDDIIKQGNWKEHENFISDPNQRITGEDFANLRDLLGVKAIDHYWLFGGIGKIKVTGEGAKKPYHNPGLCILARYLLKYPEEVPILSMPRFHEVYDALENLTNTDIPNRKAGVIFGVSGWSGNRWYHGGRATPVIQRLFYILLEAIKSEGMDGLKKYLKVVDEEARSRGFVEGFDDIVKLGKWKKQDSGKNFTRSLTAAD